MTKIDIISGFLGAGKTTLIKKLISEAYKGEKLVLVENEFGEIGVDGGFLRDAGIAVSEINSGCICCSLVGDFKKALHEVVETYAPDRIIIEPSGVGKLSDVISAAQGADTEGKAVLGALCVVVDATKARMYLKNFGEFFGDQVEHARCIVLSRTQKQDEATLSATVSLLRERNSDAVIITTPWDDITGDVIRSAMEERSSLADETLKEVEEAHRHGHHVHEAHCCCHEHAHHHHHHHEHHHHAHGEDCTCGCHDHAHHDHHADEVFVNWGVQTPRKYALSTLDTILATLAGEDCPYGTVLRAKGILQSTDGTWIQFDLTPGEYEIREGSADYTGRICVIGTKLDTDALSSLFGV